jgi:general secretion pathway protein A
MYENFFGFKERPFQLVPNPAYLFLSRSHEEALAHLTYAVSQGDGFVEITGEVGTGKTTLCRVFLENLDQNIEAAYIFNPKLNAIQLLKAINDELGVDSKANNIKILIDRLNFFLMEKKAEGKKVILVIDEAQNLSKEVLEQLRLLSNLETSTAKLLQIILVGQPELREMLDSRELRQLGQRITLSYHLLPLTFKETKEYIEHRIRVASRKPGLRFKWSALRAIYKYSGGIPRLVNIACDRSILTAYGLNQYKVTGNIAKASIRELAGRSDLRRYGIQGNEKSLLIFSALCAILLLLIFYSPVNFDFFKSKSPSVSQTSPPKAALPVKPETAEPLTQDRAEAPEPLPETAEHETSEKKPDEEVKANPEPAPAEAGQNLVDFLGVKETRASRHSALKAVLEAWNSDAVIKPYLDNMEDTQSFFRLGAKHNGLLIQRIESDIELIKRLNLPAVFEFNSPKGASPVYLALVKTDERKMTFRSEKNLTDAEQEEVESYWSGTAYVLWKNFFAYSGSIPRDTSEDSVITLKMILREIGFNEIEMNAAYDDQTREVIESIQEKNGIRVDGVVGPLTKIVLYNQMKSLEMPKLSEK